MSGSLGQKEVTVDNKLVLRETNIVGIVHEGKKGEWTVVAVSTPEDWISAPRRRRPRIPGCAPRRPDLSAVRIDRSGGAVPC